MFLSVALVCSAFFALATVITLSVGHRIRNRSLIVALLLTVALAVIAGEAASRIFRPPTEYVLIGMALSATLAIASVFACRRWNAVGSVFLGSFLAAGVSYLAFAAQVTFTIGLSPVGLAASLALWVLEAAAMILTASFIFESCDVLCNAAPVPPPSFSKDHLPMVSIHVPAYNEPPEMVIETIRSLEAIDYPRFEIVVIDNNTKDESVWKPLEEYCAGRDLVKFVHVDPWPGFKSGALNLALASHTAPDAEVIAIVDADYVVQPNFLRDTVGHLHDPAVAFVQTPQDYREFEGDTYLTACYDAYRYFFDASMESRRNRGSIIFVGTMGLIRRSALEQVGGWDEWCITEDAELSLRLAEAGYTGVFINRSFGRGIMPLTFPALKRQMFRWCFGGIQILRKHGRKLVSPSSNLRLGQRFDFLLLLLQWFNGPLSLGFAAILLVAAASILLTGSSMMRPLSGVALVMPATLIASGLLRSLWTLRHTRRISYKRCLLTFATWLSLTWVITKACLLGLVSSKGVFLRTPKWKGDRRVIEAFRETRTETSLALLVWVAGLTTTAVGGANPLLAGLFVWQGAVFAAAPFMAWLNLHTELSQRMERRRRWEWRKDWVEERRGHLALGASAAVGMAGVLVLIGFGSDPTGPRDVFDVPQRPPGDSGPLAGLADLATTDAEPTPSPSPSAPTPAPGTTGSPATVNPGGIGGSIAPAPASPPGPATSPAPGASPGPATSPASAASPGPPTSPQPAASPRDPSPPAPSPPDRRP